MAELHLSKIDVALRQLETAIRLFFQFGEPVSIHALASASAEVLGNLAEHAGLNPQVSWKKFVEAYGKPEHRDFLMAVYRKPQNFFKHADRDPGDTLVFYPKATEFVVFEACEFYFLLTKEWPPVLIAFRTWWLIQNPELLGDIPPEAKAALQGLKYRDDQRAQFFVDMTKAQVYAKGA